MNPPTYRFRDPGLFLEAMQDEILVVCPRCGACAQSVPLAGQHNGPLPARRVICTSCGYVREGGTPGRRGKGPPMTVCDSDFGLPLVVSNAVLRANTVGV